MNQEIVELVLRFAKENPSWGYDRIEGALANVGHRISDTSVGNILKANGIEPAPDRKRTTTWKTFLKAHWDVLAAIDFTTIDVWTKGGLVTYYLLFVIDLKSRRVNFAGCTPNPDEIWMKQIARNLTDCDEGFLNGSRHLIHDRDPLFTRSFRAILKSSGIETVKLPARSPNLNAYAERFVRSIKSECLAQIIPLGEQHLRHAVKEYTEHYHVERNHQGLGNRLIEKPHGVVDMDSAVVRHERLGGVLNYYERRAA